MSERKPQPDTAAAARKRQVKPAPLLFEPKGPETEPEHFFDLDAMDDPQDLLTRSTELALAFREAADRAMEFQAIAAAQLADPKRFDRLPIERIAERADWSPDYARRMVEFGQGLLKNRSALD